eukprot:gene4776-5239_t
MKVTTVGGKTYEGEFYSLDPVSKSLTLKGDGDNYIIINATHIVSYTGEIGQAADVSKFGVSTQNFEQQEMTALRLAEKALETANTKVTGEIQALFDKISSIFNHCEWSDDSIKILDEYIINPPYDKVTVLPDKEGSGLNRIQMMLQGERRKLNL